VEKLARDFAGGEDLPETLYEIAGEHERAKKYEEAKSIYERIMRDAPESWEAEKAEVDIAKVDILVLVEEGDEQAVEEALDKLIADFEEHPWLVEALFRVGEKYFMGGFSAENEGLEDESKEYFGKAVATWEKIITDMAESKYAADALLHTGDSCRRLGEYDKAIGYYQKLVDEWPDSKYAWHAQYLVAHTCEDLMTTGLMSEENATDLIRGAYERILRDYPESAAAHDARMWFENHENSSEGGEK
jgi:tetratricopeptide (TPR) repeat protein